MEKSSAIHDLLGDSSPDVVDPSGDLDSLEYKTLERALVLLSALKLRFHVVGRGVEFGAPIVPEKQKGKGPRPSRNPGVSAYGRRVIESMVVGESRLLCSGAFEVPAIQSGVCYAASLLWGRGSVTTMMDGGKVRVLRLF